MISVLQRIQGVLTPNPSLDDAQAPGRIEALHGYGLMAAVFLLIYVGLSAVNGEWLRYASGSIPPFMLACSFLVALSLWHHLTHVSRQVGMLTIGVLCAFHALGTYTNGLLAYPMMVFLVIVIRQLLPRYLAWRIFLPLALLCLLLASTLEGQEVTLALRYWMSATCLFLMLDAFLARSAQSRAQRSRAVFDRFAAFTGVAILLIALGQWLGGQSGSLLLNITYLVILAGLLLARQHLSPRHFALLFGVTLAILHTASVAAAGENVMPFVFVYFFIGAVHLSVLQFSLYAAVLCFNQLDFLLSQSALPLHGADVAVNFGLAFVMFGFAMYLVQPLFVAGAWGGRTIPMLRWLFGGGVLQAVLIRYGFMLLIALIPIVTTLWATSSNVALRSMALGWPGYFWLVMLMAIIGIASMLVVRREHELSALAAIRDSAEQHNHSQGALLSTINHDIRTPLNNLMVTLQGLRADTALTSTQQEYLHIMQTSAHKLSRLMGDMIDVSEIERGRMDLAVEPVYLPNFMSELLVNHDHQAADSDVTLLFELLKVPSVWVQTDPLRLSQVLGNLLSNAIKFSPGGTVELTVSLREEGLQFQVIDDGAGMDDATLTRVFKRFEQADNSMTRQYQGLGLGLSICRELVELMGGRMDVQSAPGHGSTFTVQLPLPMIDEVKPALKAKRIPRSKGLAEARLLVVEDDFVSRKVLDNALAEHVAELVLVAGGEQALQALSGSTFDAVLTDIAMPGMNGVELLQTMRHRGYELPVLAFTGNALADEVSSYRAVGFDAVMSKPLDTDALLQTLQRLLNHNLGGDE